MRTRELAISLALAAGFKAVAAEHRLSTADFTSVSQCAVCHQEIYGQWQTSMHSKAATDTLFQQLLPQAASDLGERGIGFCLTCHTPVATVSKEVGIYKPVSLPLKLSSVAMEGVTCDFCHTISGNEHFGNDISTGAYKYPRKGETAIKYGAHADASTTNHLSKDSKFLQSSEFCAICHKFNHPFSGAALQDTYEEWKSGPYAKSAKSGGKRCQDCHMPAFAGRGADDGPQRNDLHAHDFPGGHSEMIKKVAKVTAWAYSPKNAGRKSINLKASVENVGSGHSMPTGLPGMRQMWLEAVVRDSQGAEVFTNKSPIGIEALDQAGNPTMPWNAKRFGVDTRIGPQKKRQWSWSIQVPENSSGPLDIKVTVFYRLVSEVAAKAAGMSPSLAQQIASDHLKINSDGGVEKISVD